jgi:hypothetical protein
LANQWLRKSISKILQGFFLDADQHRNQPKIYEWTCVFFLMFSIMFLNEKVEEGEEVHIIC